MSDEYPLLLQTKLHRPRLPKDLVTRKRLVELLNHDITQPLILVCAPAGFGKSTLLSNWLRLMTADPNAASAGLPAAWLSLDENDSDLNLFLRYFIGALRTIFSGACEATMALLQAQQQPPETVIHTTFINELENLPGEVILVLDDYHTIHGEQVHKLLAELAHHWPRPLHLVLISRTSPPLPLNSLRARGMLSEIRTRDLRFTPEETAAYLNQAQFTYISQPALTLLEERLEGWPAALHLAALSLRSAASQEAVLSVLSSKNHNITGYLVDEVLGQQFPAIRRFLLKTSILDHFCASLCERVAGEIDPAWSVDACLEWIERSELFLIPLDDHREWFRYHHLFQEMLQQRLSNEIAPEDVNILHLQASAWFEEQGLNDEAIHHALAAGNIDLVARQMSAGMRDVINREDRPTLERWLRLLPEEIAQQHPWLLMMKVWVLQFGWQLDRQARELQELARLLEIEDEAFLPADERRILLGQAAAFHGQRAYLNNQSLDAIDLFKDALARIPDSWTYLYGGAMHYLGMSMQASGNGFAAEQLLLDEYRIQVEKAHPYALRLLLGLIFIYYLTGQLEKTVQIAQIMRQGSSQSGLPILQCWAERFLGVVNFEWNDLGIAAQHFTWIVNNRYTSQISAYRDAVTGLALIHQILGESLNAWQMVESIRQFDLEQSGIEDERTLSLRARLMLLQGNLEIASQWADTYTSPPPDRPLLWMDEPQLTRVRILLTRGDNSDFNLALQILDTLDDIADRTHNTRYKIEILALRAVALDAQGQVGEAGTLLKQAIDLARPGGFIRVFVNMGKPMQKMLQRLIEQGHSVEQVRRILAAFQDDEEYLLNRTSHLQPEHQPLLSSPNLAEPLTPREQEVLALLQGPSSIKEIAQQLHISYATAKRHTVNIYAKLEVNQRWKAVARAEELSLLPPR